MRFSIFSILLILSVFYFSSCNSEAPISPEQKLPENNSKIEQKDLPDELQEKGNSVICSAPTINYFQTNSQSPGTSVTIRTGNPPLHDSWSFGVTDLTSWYPNGAKIWVKINGATVYHDTLALGTSSFDYYDDYYLGYGNYTFELVVKNYCALGGSVQTTRSSNLYIMELWSPDAPSIYGASNPDHPAIAWSAVSGTSIGYKIFKSYNSSGPFYQIGTTTSLSYVDYGEDNWDGVPPKGYVNYRVKAYDTVYGGESDFSNIVQKVIKQGLEE